MKYFLCVVLGCVYYAKGALWMSDVYELARRCNKLPEVNGSEEDVTELLMGYLPDSRSGRCMLKCMQEHVGILTNGSYDLKGAYLFFRTSFPENPHFKNMERAVRFCGKIVEQRRTVDMDPCHYAHMVASCIKRRIIYRPGCRAAFYNPFKWHNPSRKATVRPRKKYFVPDPKFMEKIQFEIITKPTRKYTLDDLEKRLSSRESVEPQAYVFVPPKLRKGKWGRRKKEEMKEKRKKEKEGDGSENSEIEVSDIDDSWDRSSKTRRHIKKQLII